MLLLIQKVLDMIGTGAPAPGNKVMHEAEHLSQLVNYL